MDGKYVPEDGSMFVFVALLLRAQTSAVTPGRTRRSCRPCLGTKLSHPSPGTPAYGRGDPDLEHFTPHGHGSQQYSPPSPSQESLVVGCSLSQSPMHV